MSSLRNQACCASRCQSVSGFCTTPIPEPATVSRRYSGRSGGSVTAKLPATLRVSAMGGCLLLFDPVGKQHIVDAVGQLASRRILGIATVAIKFALHLPGVR